MTSQDVMGIKRLRFLHGVIYEYNKKVEIDGKEILHVAIDYYPGYEMALMEIVIKGEGTMTELLKVMRVTAEEIRFERSCGDDIYRDVRFVRRDGKLYEVMTKRDRGILSGEYVETSIEEILGLMFKCIFNNK